MPALRMLGEHKVARSPLGVKILEKGPAGHASGAGCGELELFISLIYIDFFCKKS